MTKLKQLLPANVSKVQIKSPVTQQEWQDRMGRYHYVDALSFAKRYHHHLFRPIEFTWEDKVFSIQYNYCTNPFCESFAAPQEKFETVKYKPSRYKLVGTSKSSKSLKCNPVPVSTHPHYQSLSCYSSVLSNWAIAEEIKRLIHLETIIPIEPDYVFHKPNCTVSDTPFTNPKSFYRRGKSTSNSTKYQCRTCSKFTNVLPTKRQSTKYHQKRNDILPQFMKLLLNHTPVRRTCEILGIGKKTYYTKLEWVYRCCLEFLARHEKKFAQMELDSLWINSDKLQYNLNNVRKKGKGGKYEDERDSLQLQTLIMVSAHMDSRYVFRSDIAYDSKATMAQIEQDTMFYKDDHVEIFARKNARLRFTNYPMPPTKFDKQPYSEYLDEVAKAEQRKDYADGLHVNASYTALAHFFLLKEQLNAKKWRFVADGDETIIRGIMRVFNEEIKALQGHVFTLKIDEKKKKGQAYQEYKDGIKDLENWAKHKGITGTTSNLAYMYLQELLQTHKFIGELTLPSAKTVRIPLVNPILHPLPTLTKGNFEVNVRTDVSDLEDSHLANMLLKVNDYSISNFMQQIRRRLSILERPLVTSSGDGKSYIYANFNPKYAQQAVTILRTYYNFCMPYKDIHDVKMTPAQRIGLTNKIFTIYDVLYK